MGVGSRDVGGHGIGLRANNKPSGLTAVELMVALIIIVTLVGLIVTAYRGRLTDARVVRSVSDIKKISTDIESYAIDNDELPQSLEEIGHGKNRDPWDNPYQYLDLRSSQEREPRKAPSNGQINTDFDLYSMGRDGKSKPPIDREESKDDVIRANDGRYVGPVWEY
jgi:general secretion pathway protein G